MGQGPRMSSCLCLSLHLPGFRGKAAAIVQGQPPGICTPPLPSHTKETRAHLIAQGSQVLKGQSGPPSGQGSLCL